MMGWSLACAALAGAYAWRWRGAGSSRRLAAFLAGVAALWVAAVVPLARGHLVAHMLQHLILMTVAAPLLLLGEPMRVLAPAARRFAPHPAVCWLAGTMVVLVWHVPSVFAFGMRWHALQEATFLAGGLLFWLPVIQPWPTKARWSRWSIPVYLFLATMPCDALSAFLTFCGRTVYAHGDLADQTHAGALMWFWVTIAYLVPAALVTVELLSPRPRREG